MRSALRAALPVLALVLAACGVEAGDTSVPRLTGDVVGGGGIPPTTEAPTTTSTLPRSKADLLDLAVEDVEAFWADAFPEVYGAPYEPLSGGVFTIDSSVDPDDIPCAAGAQIEELLDNAFYCPPADAMAFDLERFLPSMAEQHGDLTVAVIVAHEWGHAVQQRAEVTAPPVIMELQADCFAGAWTAHVADGGSERFTADVDQLDQALTGILSLRDAPGADADDPLAHGSGFDRVAAFQDGFEAGAERCAEYRNGDPQPFQWPFSGTELLTEGDLPLSGPPDAPGIVELAFPSLDAFWTDTFPAVSDGEPWLPLGDPVPFPMSEPPDCGGAPVVDFVLFVCIPDRYVGFEAIDTLPAAYEEGDFAVATLFATQYGLDAVDQLGSADDEVTATLQADCFAGAWAGALVPRGPNQPPEAYELVLSPGDLDEGVAVLLTFRSDADRTRQGPGFPRVSAFRTGVLRGAEACPAVGS